MRAEKGDENEIKKTRRTRVRTRIRRKKFRIENGARKQTHEGSE